MMPTGKDCLAALALWTAATTVAAEFVLHDSKVLAEAWYPTGLKFQDKECVLWMIAANSGNTFPLECSTAGSGLVEYSPDVSAGAMDQRFGYPHAATYVEAGGSDYLLFGLSNYGSAGTHGGYVYRRDGAETSFTLFQEIYTIHCRGAAIWTLPGSDQPMLALGQPDLATGNYYAGRGLLEIYALQGGSFQLVQTIEGGFTKVHAFNIGGRGYLAAGVQHSHNPKLWETDSLIYEWSGSEYTLAQAIPTKMCMEFLPFKIGAATYLVAVNNRDDNDNLDQHAVVYQWASDSVGGGGAFSEMQRFPIHNGQGAAVVSIGGLTFLAIGCQAGGGQAQVYLWSGAGFDSYQELGGPFAANIARVTGFTIDGQAYFGLMSSEGASMWMIDEASMATTTATTSGTTTTSATATSGTTATATTTTATSTTTGTTGTATGTTLTTTGTATETWPLVAQCTMSALTCPIPRRVARTAHVSYAILGNESAATGQPCGPPPATSGPMLFTVDAHACNVTATGSIPDQLELAVTLVPVVEPGQLIFADSEPPIILCKCTFSNNTATVGLGVAVEIDDGPARNVDGGSAFSPTLRLFSDPLFTEPISPGQAFPVTSELFYVEVTSNQTEDVIGVPACTVAPTNDTDHAFAQPLLDGYCGTQAFGVVYSSNPGDGGPSHTLRWSMRKFKFAGYPAVHIVCEVTRCGAPPCGTCGSTQQGGRRLHRDLQQDPDGVATSYFSLPPGGTYLVLPGDVPEGAKRVKFVSPSRPQAASDTAWVNVTIYSFPGIEDGGQFATHFEELVRGHVGSEVHVQQVWQVGDSAISDVTIVSIYQGRDGTAEDFDSRMQQLPQSSLFLPTLLQMLGEHGHTTELMRMEVSSTRAVPGPRGFLATGPAPDPSSAPAQLPVIIAAVAALVVVTAVVASVLWMRSRRRRAQQQAGEQAAKAAEGGPGKVDQAALGAEPEREARELAEAAEGGFIEGDRPAVAATAAQEAGERVATDASEGEKPVQSEKSVLSEKSLLSL